MQKRAQVVIVAMMINALVGLLLFVLGIAMPRIQLPLELRFGGPDDVVYPDPLPTEPSIGVIVPAYLESSTVPHTVLTLRRALDGYGGPSTITVVASDHATAMAARRSGADVVIETAREGKPAAANRGVAETGTDVVVFTDANCEIAPVDWPDRVVKELNSWHLVSGNKTERGTRESFFWRREQSTKLALSAVTGTVSVVGEFIAMRRYDFVPIPPDAICDDLWLACALASQKKRVKVVDGIRTIEDPAANSEQWGRRVRIAEGLFKEQLTNLRQLLGTRIGRLFVGHKLYRVTIGAFGFWLMVASLTLVYLPVSLIVAPIVALLVAVYAGVLVPRAKLTTFVSAIGMQAVPLVGLWRVLYSAARRTPVPSPGWAKVER